MHPGYGFLSERGAFAQAVTDAGLIWVGPPPAVLKAISSKCYTRQLAVEAGAEVTPGTLKPVASPEEVISFGSEHGYPLFLKLDKGGGGKGIEMVSGPGQAAEVFKRACSIGAMAFGSPACYIETVVLSSSAYRGAVPGRRYGPRGLPGGARMLYPAPTPEDHRRGLFPGGHSRGSRKDVRQRRGHRQEDGLCWGAGTLEGLRLGPGRLLLHGGQRPLAGGAPGERIPQPERISCVINWRSPPARACRLARRMSLSGGHAIEARVYAEDPETFFPSPGTISKVVLPAESENLRVDHALADGCTVPPYYDPMLAKVVAWDRDQAFCGGPPYPGPDGLPDRGSQDHHPA